MSEILNPPPFLIEGFDGATPLQAYCTVVNPYLMIVDTIYPYHNISIFVENNDVTNQFGDNAYTRRTTIKELIELGRIIHGVKHFYHCYKAVLRTYNELEAMEYEPLQSSSVCIRRRAQSIFTPNAPTLEADIHSLPSTRNSRSFYYRPPRFSDTTLSPYADS